MANITYFDAMDGQYTWADNGDTSGWEVGQYKQGWATIGDTKPSVEQFNTTHQLIDRKANWLYAQTKYAADERNVSVAEADEDVLSRILAKQLESIYPVGSIYFNASDSTNPGAFLPGTWKKMSEGFLYPHGAPDAGAAGHTQGETRHQLTANELPKFTPEVTVKVAGRHTHKGTTTTNGNHNHSYEWRKGNFQGSHTVPSGSATGDVKTSNTNYAGNHTHDFTTHAAGNHTHTATAKQIGGGSAHNNMPPAITVYIWKRTA